MPTPRNIITTGLSRLWLQEGGAGPGTAPEYMGVWKAGAVTWGRGDATAIEIPSDSAYDQFEEVASIAGTEEKPSMTVTARYSQDASEMLRIRRRGCTNDLQVHFGSCQDPQDFTGGWNKILAFDKFTPASYGIGDMTALSSDERAAVDETLDISAKDLYEILKVSFAAICGSSVVQEVADVTYCDAKTCGGECGLESDGCKKLYALIKASGGSPGLGPQIVYSDDGGSTCGSTPITTLAANEEPNEFACLGLYIVVVSEDAGNHHYALKEEILLGTETWQESAAYTSAPRCIFALKANYAWVGGAGGYVYFLDNPTNAPTTLDAGAATAQDLNAIHAFDEEHILAVGAANAVVHSTDGATFSAVTGPAPAVALNCCFMKSETEWWVGSAAGNLYYTLDSGVTWTLKTFPGSGAGQVYDVLFVGSQVGYLAHATAAPAGRILRTIDGGYQWYVLPEGTGSIPANDRINALASCGDVNKVLGGGLADNAADGILVLATG